METERYLTLSAWICTAIRCDKVRIEDELQP